MIQDAINKLVNHESLTRAEAQEAMQAIMDGGATPAQIAGFLIALRMKGETVDEIAGFAEIMTRKAARIKPKARLVVDTCGTGGDKSGTFNVSTVVAFVAAGAGVTVAKHGNRAVSSKCGSADMLEALGVNINLAPAEVEACLNDVGIGFLFAPVFHQATQAVAAARREIGIRTIFNILGPLTNPAGATHQLLGVYDRRLLETIARVLMERGTKRALVVHGDGLDEITTCGITAVAELQENTVRSYEISPDDFGIPRASLADLQGGSPEKNAMIARRVLGGERGPKRDIVLLNSAAVLYLAGKAPSIRDGIAPAADVVDRGLALEKLESLIDKTGGMRHYDTKR